MACCRCGWGSNDIWQGGEMRNFAARRHWCEAIWAICPRELYALALPRSSPHRPGRPRTMSSALRPEIHAICAHRSKSVCLGAGHVAQSSPGAPRPGGAPRWCGCSARFSPGGGLGSRREPIRMRNTTGATVYYLFFALQKPAASELYQDIKSKCDRRGLSTWPSGPRPPGTHGDRLLEI